MGISECTENIPVFGLPSSGTKCLGLPPQISQYLPLCVVVTKVVLWCQVIEVFTVCVIQNKSSSIYTVPFLLSQLLPLLPSGEKGREQGGLEEVLGKARQLERSVAELSVTASQQRQDLVGAVCSAVE